MTEEKTYRFQKGDWVIEKNVENPKGMRIRGIDKSSDRCYIIGEKQFTEDELEQAEDHHLPQPDFDAPISMNMIHAFRMYFHWRQPSVGFGEFSIGLDKDGKFTGMTEGMGPEWSRKAMHAAVDAAVDQAIKDGVWPPR